MYDIAIIGAGIIGASVAYELSRYRLKILWLEKENDVSLGATRANSAIVHAGYDPPAGSRMARLNVEGTRLMPALCEAVDAHYKNTGSLVLAFDERDRSTLRSLKEQGDANGVPSLQVLNREETLAREPALNPDIVGSLYAPSAGIILPWELTLGLAEVAVREGVDLRLRQELQTIRYEADHWKLETQNETYQARRVINAAGQGAEKIHRQATEPAFHLLPTRGEYYLLDKAVDPQVSHVLFQCPGPLGKGILVTPTIHGNTLIGPNAELIEDGEDTSTTYAGLAEVAQKARRSVPNLRFGENIRHFSGVRANREVDDFYIAMHEKGFLDLAAIKSPGLSAAPAIALYARELLEADGLEVQPREGWNGRRKVTRFAERSPEDKAAMVDANPAFGRVICRCQTITEGEILEAIRSPIPPVSIDAIKRRTGAGLGRCQGGFCGPRVLEILSRELGVDPAEILQDKDGSYIVLGDNRPEVRI